MTHGRKSKMKKSQLVKLIRECINEYDINNEDYAIMKSREKEHMDNLKNKNIQIR